MTHSAFACSAHQNVMLMVNAMDLDLTYKQLIKKMVYNIESNKCIMYRCESYPGIATLTEFLNHEPSEHEDDEKFHYYQYDTMDRGI